MSVKPIIAPSLLSADFNRLGEEIEMLNRSEADWIHLDVMDGVFVPNISFGMPVIKAVRKLHDEIIAPCLFRRFLHLFPGRVRTGNGNVVVNRILEQVHPLEHHADLVHQPAEGYFPDILSLHQDPSVSNVPEARQQ